MHFLKSTSLSEFLILESKLFHSIVVQGKKEYLKLSFLTLKRGILFLCLVIYGCLVVFTNSKRYLTRLGFYKDHLKSLNGFAILNDSHWKTQIYCHTINFQISKILPETGSKKNGAIVLWLFLLAFFKKEPHWLFSILRENFRFLSITGKLLKII